MALDAGASSRFTTTSTVIITDAAITIAGAIIHGILSDSAKKCCIFILLRWLIQASFGSDDSGSSAFRGDGVRLEMLLSGDLDL